MFWRKSNFLFHLIVSLAGKILFYAFLLQSILMVAVAQVIYLRAWWTDRHFSAYI